MYVYVYIDTHVYICKYMYIYGCGCKYNGYEYLLAHQRYCNFIYKVGSNENKINMSKVMKYENFQQIYMFIG